MKAVVLAAGDGGRLRPLTDSRPKVLLPVQDRPLISYPLDAIIAEGVTDIAVIVGHQADQVMEAVPGLVPGNVRIEFVYNPHYDGGNAVSVHAAKAFVGDNPFILSMGDHLIEPAVVSRLLAKDSDTHVLGIDSAPSLESQINDATRVLVDSAGRLLKIGKELDEWNAVDIGVFTFGPHVFDSIDRLHNRHGNSLELSQVMQYLADQDASVSTCDVEGLSWNDIDTIEDYLGAGGIEATRNGIRV